MFLAMTVLGISKDQDEKISPNHHTFHVRMNPSDQILWNAADNINVWYYRSEWHEKMEQVPEDYFRQVLPFVKYVQLMTAAGGNNERDLFKDPFNANITDDYDFAPLIRACRNVIRQGLTPHLKLGNVPMKYSKNYKIGEAFSVNILPPDDYRLWHKYIKALIRSLVDEFGLESVKTWRFGCITEYENADWFSVDNNSEKTRDAYLKLYDYTVDALQQVLGENICVGAHSMTCTEGLWDERELIAHCAHGVNYCTGKIGTGLRFLASSFYEGSPGKPVSGNPTLPKSIDLLRKSAEKEGLNDLFYGIDEGRILNGLDNKPLYPRAVGYTWQAAFDAKLYHQAYDNKIDYFSHWCYTTNGLSPGILSVAAQTALLFYQMNGAARLPLEHETNDLPKDEEINAIAAWNREQNKIYLLFYAYSNSVHAQGNKTISCQLSGIEKSGRVTAIRTLVSNESNFFDNWLADWTKLGITKDNFDWSSDSFVINPSLLPADRLPYYKSCAALNPETETLTVQDGILNIRTTLPIHGVLLYEINLL
jgi:xylan 1,4-beta-xylosidase